MLADMVVPSRGVMQRLPSQVSLETVDRRWTDGECEKKRQCEDWGRQQREPLVGFGAGGRS